MICFSRWFAVPILVVILVLTQSEIGYAESSEEQSAEKNSKRTYETFESLVYLYQPYLSNITAYEPIYFLVGTKPEKSKFQFSVKYRFLDIEEESPEKVSWAEGLHFGYTQTSFWNLKDDSRPFEDTSYKPELFHLSKNIRYRPQWTKGFFMQTGVRHESNGQADALSRSTNFCYLRPIFILYGEKSRLGFAVSPSLWVYFDNSTKNDDLEDYRGNLQLDLVIGHAESFVLSSNWRWAEEGGSLQIDLSYPTDSYLLKSLKFYLHFQYVNALAESLLDYRTRNEAFRIGFSVIR